MLQICQFRLWVQHPKVPEPLHLTGLSESWNFLANTLIHLSRTYELTVRFEGSGVDELAIIYHIRRIRSLFNSSVGVTAAI